MTIICFFIPEIICQNSKNFHYFSLISKNASLFQRNFLSLLQKRTQSFCTANAITTPFFPFRIKNYNRTIIILRFKNYLPKSKKNSFTFPLFPPPSQKTRPFCTITAILLVSWKMKNYRNRPMFRTRQINLTAENQRFIDRSYYRFVNKIVPKEMYE